MLEEEMKKLSMMISETLKNHLENLNWHKTEPKKTVGECVEDEKVTRGLKIKINTNSLRIKEDHNVPKQLAKKVDSIKANASKDGPLDDGTSNSREENKANKPNIDSRTQKAIS